MGPWCLPQRIVGWGIEGCQLKWNSTWPVFNIQCSSAWTQQDKPGILPPPNHYSSHCRIAFLPQALRPTVPPPPNPTPHPVLLRGSATVQFCLWQLELPTSQQYLCPVDAHFLFCFSPVSWPVISMSSQSLHLTVHQRAWGTRLENKRGAAAPLPSSTKRAGLWRIESRKSVPHSFPPRPCTHLKDHQNHHEKSVFLSYLSFQVTNMECDDFFLSSNKYFFSFNFITC